MHPSSDRSKNQSNITATDKDRRETERLAALDYLDIVRPEADHVLQELVDDVRSIFGVDLCNVNLVLSDVQYFRAWSGEFPADLAEARQDPRERSMCQHVVASEAPLVVHDFLATEEFKDQYFCVNYGIRFYAGVPLVTSDGHAIGVLCLQSSQPREFSEDEMILLKAFARAVVGRLELLGAFGREQAAKDEEAQRARELQRKLDASLDMITDIGLDGVFKTMNVASKTILGYEPEELVGRSFMDLVHPDDRDCSARLTAAIVGGSSADRFENRCLRKDGSTVWIEWSTTPLSEEGVMYCVARDITERKQAERALKESQRRFRQLFDQSVDALLVHDASGRIVDCNEEACRSLGYTREELLSFRIKDIATDLVSDEEKRFRTEPTLWQRAMSSEPGRLAGVHWGEHQRKDGTTFPVEVYVGSVDYGEQRMIFASIRDITERKLVERELREAEERFRSSFEDAAIGMALNDLDGRFVQVNRALCEMLGRSEEELLDKTFREITHPDDLDISIDRVQRVLAGEVRSYSLEKRYVHADGHPVWVSLNVSSVRDPEGHPLYLVAQMQDITERKWTEEALKEQREFLRQIIDADPSFIFVKDWDGKFTLVNKALADVYGTTPEELIGKSDADFNSNKEEVEAFLRADREVMETLQSKHIPEEPVTDSRTGEVHWFQTIKVPLVSSTDGSRQVLGVSTNITERKRAEEELLEAKEQAEAANRAKSDFLANMSHEIRTPMNGIIGMTELLLGTELSEEQREYAETVRYSSEALLTIINDILDFSKIEAGKMSIETTDFNLQTVVEEVVGLFAERAQDKGLELASLVEHGLPTALRGDPVRLRQVLANLTGNAIKFTEEGEVVLHVDLEESMDDAVTLRFEVTDSGIGITPEQRERLFQSFSQADTSTTRRYGGTGLGLVISKQLVELMGGEIGVESEPGVGSTFWFTVPLAKQSEEAPAAPRSLIGDALRNLHVLIVDDNPTNRRILSRQIAPWSIHSENTEDGPRALQILRAAAERGAPYDLAILDMQMPGMDGIQLARAIKADPDISSVRLILLTSVGKRGDGEEAEEAGTEAYLTKPVKQSELYDALATVMDTSTETAPPEEKQLVTHHSLRETKARLRPHVLVAEDNPVNQKVAAMMLERLGYQVDVAANGLEALEALSHASYAAVLMDVQMPELDGYKATAEIRRREGEPGHEGRRTPIIAMTANAMQGDREKALEAGMDDYVSKPVKAEELGEVLKRWIRRETSEQDVSSQVLDNGPAIRERTEDSVDYAVLESLRGLQEEGEPDILAELVELFLADVPPRLTTLREAVEKGDAHSVEQIAHALKGSCGNMGARRMADICAELQDVGTSDDLARAPELLGQLEAEFDRVRPALEDQVERS